MTTRKHTLLPVLTALLLAGCATPGPLHLYTTSPGAPTTIDDTGAGGARASIPSFISTDESVVGFAYDPFTDHFFLRLAPGDLIRVVDRPARAIKREFRVASLAASHRGDLAIRPRDGHVFTPHATEAAVVEFNRFGEAVRTLPLASLSTPPTALAYDSARDRLLALTSGDLARITTHDLQGQRLSTIALDRAVALTALAYDSDQSEFYALLAHDRAIGVFSEVGRLVRTVPLASDPDTTLFDVGPRSFLRLF